MASKLAEHCSDERGKIYHVIKNGKVVGVAKEYIGKDAQLRKQNEEFAYKYLKITETLNTPRLLSVEQNKIVIEYIPISRNHRTEIVLNDLAKFHAANKWAYERYAQEIFPQLNITYRNPEMFFLKLEQTLSNTQLNVPTSKTSRIKPSSQPLTGLIHGDFNPSHILEGDTNFYRYIDFELFGIESLLGDIATYIITSRQDQEEIMTYYLICLRKAAKRYGKQINLTPKDVRNEVAFRACQGLFLTLESNKSNSFKQRVKSNVENALNWALQGI